MDAKSFWHLNSHKYKTYWIANANDDKIIFENSDDLWRYMNDFLEQSHKPVVSGPASAVSGGGELLAGALAKTVCDGFKECTDVKGIMCKCEGKCELKEETSVAPLEGFYRKKGQ